MISGAPQCALWFLLLATKGHSSGLGVRKSRMVLFPVVAPAARHSLSLWLNYQTRGILFDALMKKMGAG